MKKIFLVVTVLTFVAHAQTTTVVNQGKPGTQGPWPVTFSFAPDGGGAIPVYSMICKQADNDGGTLHKLVTVSGTAVNVPTASATGRVYVEICNSLQNTGNPSVKCRADGVAPVMAAGNAGTVLGLGDCVQFAASPYNVVQCIADTANTNVTSYECVPGTPSGL